MWPFNRKSKALTAPPLSPWADSSLLEAVTFAHLFDAPQIVTRPAAMSLPAIAKGRNIIASQIGRMPLEAMRGGDNVTAQFPFLRQPEEYKSRFNTITWTVDALIFYGVAYWHVTRRDADSNGGRPRVVELVENHDLILDTAAGALTARLGDVDVDPADIIRIDGPHEGILAYGAPVLRSALALSRAAGRAAANPVPSIELHQTEGEPLSTEAAEELVSRWAKRRETHGVAYTNPNVLVKTHGQPPEQLLIAAQRDSSANLARLIGVPAWAVDASVQGQSMTYSNAPSRSRELVDMSLIPYMEAISSRLSMDDVLPAGVWCRFDTTELLRADFSERMNAYSTAIEAGIYSVDELRELERGKAKE